MTIQLAPTWHHLDHFCVVAYLDGPANGSLSSPSTPAHNMPYSMTFSSLFVLQGRIHDNDKAPRSLQNAAMHLRKTCNHPYLFVDPSYQPSDPEELIRSSGKLELLDRILPMLHATGEHDSSNRMSKHDNSNDGSDRHATHAGPCLASAACFR